MPDPMPADDNDDAARKVWVQRGPPLRQIIEPGPACLHDQCTRCHGSGQIQDGSGIGACVHMISCPCRRCTPRY